MRRRRHTHTWGICAGDDNLALRGRACFHKAPPLFPTRVYVCVRASAVCMTADARVCNKAPFIIQNIRDNKQKCERFKCGRACEEPALYFAQQVRLLRALRRRQVITFKISPRRSASLIGTEAVSLIIAAILGTQSEREKPYPAAGRADFCAPTLNGTAS